MFGKYRVSLDPFELYDFSFSCIQMYRLPFKKLPFLFAIKKILIYEE